GYKIANPTVLARIPHDELDALLTGYGYRAWYVEGHDPMPMHAQMAGALEEIFDEIARLQAAARDGDTTRPRWPVLVLRSPKGWTGPAVVDGLPVEGTWRAHQVPLAEVRTNPEHLAQLEGWLRSYEPESLFDADGRPFPAIVATTPDGDLRMGATPYANGGR